MYLKNFNPNADYFKYYYPCSLPLTKKRLESLGCYCPITLLLSLDLRFMPVLRLDEKNFYLESRIRDVIFLEYEAIEDILKLNEIRTHYPDFETGMENLISQISQDEMPAICGATYFLPYSGDYKDPRYIERVTMGDGSNLWGHWLGVVGIEDDEVTVFDTTPEVAVRKMSKQDFKNFWSGDKSIPEVADKTWNYKMFGYKRIRVDKVFLKPDAIDLIKKCLKTAAYEYFEEKTIKKDGFVYYFGGSALKNYLDKLTKNCTSENMQMYLDCFFGMKFTRYFLRDTLAELAGFCDETDAVYYEELRDSIQKIIDIWDSTTADYPVKLLIDFPDFLDKVIELNAMEKEFFSRLLDIHDKCGLLPKVSD